MIVSLVIVNVLLVIGVLGAQKVRSNCLQNYSYSFSFYLFIWNLVNKPSEKFSAYLFFFSPYENDKYFISHDNFFSLTACSKKCETGLCEKTTGDCFACKDGYWGKNCEQSMSSEKFFLYNSLIQKLLFFSV